MWSDSARKGSLLARGGGTGGSGGGVAAAPVGGGGGGGGNVAAQGAGLQAGLAKAGASSRGQWVNPGKGQHTRVTITGDGPAAHQTGVHSIARNMDQSAGSMGTYSPTAYLYPNVASSATASGPFSTTRVAEYP